MNHQDLQKQGVLESLLLQIWAQDPPESSTVEEVFGPLQNWLLQLGTHLLLLHPVRKEWFYFDRLHDTWERTGFGPGEVEFVARDNVLGTRKKKVATSVPPAPSMGQPPPAPPVSAPADAPSTTACPACGAQVVGRIAFCTQCGTSLKAPRPQATVAEQVLACPACQHRNAPGVKFCVQCGAALVGPGPRAAAASQETVCRVCQHPNARSTRFCVQCGARLG